MPVSSLTISAPTDAQREQVFALMPRLAQFQLPASRVPEHLWHGDAAMLRRWFDGDAPDVHVFIASDADTPVAGMAMISMGEELLSRAPSAHLEALAVSATCEGNGVGSALLDHAQNVARELGAASMSLSVFTCNERARRVYSRAGYEEELIRCIRWFDDE